MNTDNSKSTVRLPLLLAVAIAAGIFIGAKVAGDVTESPEAKKGAFKFREILNHIDQNYVDEVDQNKLVENAITSLLEDLDPHTIYIPAEDHELSQAQLRGNFEGIGIEYNIFRDTVYVVSPLSGGPSEEVGLLTGDKIIKVDEELVAGIGIRSKDVLDKLRGPKGSKVSVSILRKGLDEFLDFEIIRDKIPQFSIDADYMVDEEIGYIKINRFTATTYDEFSVSMEKLLDQGMTKLILDLTGNPGGYMDRAVSIADEFLPGDPMIVFTKGKEYRYNQEHTAGEEGVFESQPLIVLIDEGSASASEIVSGAVQDNDRGLIVGRRSFGKGLVQMPIELSDGSELRLTISRYYTPSGRSIQKAYGEDFEDYHSDIYTRYESGEMYNADSVDVIDSLKFKTSKGRLVYGGGGIVPDIYVPLDTVGGSSYLNKLFTSNSIREYALNYSNAHREELESMGFEKYYDTFTLSDSMLDDLVKVANTNNISFDATDFNKSKSLIGLYVKAQIARGVWNNNGFYPIWNQTNEIYREALGLFDKAIEIQSM